MGIYRPWLADIKVRNSLNLARWVIQPRSPCPDITTFKIPRGEFIHPQFQENIVHKATSWTWFRSQSYVYQNWVLQSRSLGPGVIEGNHSSDNSFKISIVHIELRMSNSLLNHKNVTLWRLWIVEILEKSLRLRRYTDNSSKNFPGETWISKRGNEELVDLSYSRSGCIHKTT